ncbi:uncharacterized protein LOC132300293 [Cornus florida]|uniref:uncharacterized protein LOC132300293 n=1 Tax=Cornus florida TaxID=4283 RepID=UPI0028965504|nr:uncharacterized protein LOC132300293 [Cornus florida]
MDRSMSEQQNSEPQAVEEPKGRPVGGTEYSWCKAVPGGTGITVLGLLLSKTPDLSVLQNALHNLQITHPILRSKLHTDTPTTNYSNTFSYRYMTPPTSPLDLFQIQWFDLPSTAHVLQTTNDNDDDNSFDSDPFHLILEHELNRNTWSRNSASTSSDDTDVLFASVYSLSDEKWVVALRLHTSACDRMAGVWLLRELLELLILRMRGKEEGESGSGGLQEEVISLGIEDYIPSGKDKKPFWARGVDMLGDSLNSFKLSNLDFRDVHSPRASQVVRLQIASQHTHGIISGCKSRGIRLCGALAAAGLIAARSSKDLPDDQWEKYAVVTLIDCRSILDPVLSSHHLGFYHSAIVNTHGIRGGENFWELAKRTYTAFADAKNNNKHFSDMADLNFLMCKAIDNPGLTPSSSLRTSFISVFEDSVIDHSNKSLREIGLEDYLGCASVHGVGPSIAIFDTIRDGELDCACVYPSPLHSRKQMQELVNKMKRILVDASTCVEGESGDC